MTAKHFRDDDAGYLRWVDEHPEGYVVNLRRRFDPGYVVLHRASCATVRRYSGMDAHAGGFTSRGYTKLCGISEAEALEAVQALGGAKATFSKRCSRCV